MRKHIRLSLFAGAGIVALTALWAILMASGSAVAKKPGGNAEVGRYTVSTTGDVFFVPTTGEGKDGAGQGLELVRGDKVQLALSHFITELAPDGELCFPETAEAEVVITKKGQGRAEVSAFFYGTGTNQLTSIFYVLHMSGTFDNADNFLPRDPGESVVMTLDTWDIKVDTGGNRKIACTGEGGFLNSPIWTITKL